MNRSPDEQRDQSGVSRRRRMTDTFGITRQPDAPGLSWPNALVQGLFWGIALGVFQFRRPGGFSIGAFLMWLAIGLLLYAPGVHWVSHRLWRRLTRSNGPGDQSKR